MRKIITAILICALVVCLLLSCSYAGTYDEGYADGHDDGYFNAEYDMQYVIEHEYFAGYDIGYSDGYNEGSNYGWMDNIDDVAFYFEEEAEYYARNNSGWHPEEAWMIIEAYQNNEPLHEDGSVPSKQDYLDAIDSLIYFYDYFYSARYE